MKKQRFDPRQVPAKSAGWTDDRLNLATPLRRILNKVFPDHWSFLLGEIALYSFVVLLLTGTFLALFYDPSMTEVHYDGSYTPLQGVPMSAAYRSTVQISFDVRGGLVIRQMHHWSALLFMAAIIVHASRIFFTGAFRKPREINWVIGLSLFWLGFFEGFLGYGLPDDALSGTGLRIAWGILLSVPLIGTWASFAAFGGEFPGEVVLGRMYILHVFLLPGIIVALIALHIVIMWVQKHTQWAGPGRTERNVVGDGRFFPGFVIKTTGFFLIIFAMIAMLAGLFQINPIWLFGPYRAAVVSGAAHPDWYVMFMDGAVRLFPAWEISAFGYTISPLFWPGVVGIGALTVVPMLYPFIEARRTKDRAYHSLLQRPRDNPARTGVGVMALTFYVVLLLSGANDLIAYVFDISLNAMTWAGRIGLLILPPIGYYLTYRICLGVQQHDREVLAHGVETGIIRRLPSGQFVEVHQPLGPTDDHGHGELEYAGWTVPKKMNRLGALIPAVKGFFVPIEKPAEAPVSPVPEDRKELTGRR